MTWIINIFWRGYYILEQSPMKSEWKELLKLFWHGLLRILWNERIKVQWNGHLNFLECGC
ncbi:hypothetical protein B5C03_07885 [Staphylococcus delphini]|nr:hypothetical protein B5C03_07885 [Staphylococcus delphini]PCF61511.1 hypothetical protein B5C05_00850 [Staphylococcus delphini]